MITLNNIAAVAAPGADTLTTLLDTPLQRTHTPAPAHELPLREFTGKLKGAQRLDYACPMNHMHISRVMPESARDEDAYTVRLGNQHAFGMSAFAVRQLNQKLSKGFASYASQLNEWGKYDLYLDNVNDLLRYESRQAQVRVLQNGSTYARAVVSDKYAKYDDNLVFGAAFNVLRHETKRFHFLGGNRTDTRTYFKVVSKTPLFDLEIGGKTRPFSAGFIISNSEVGLGNVTFQAFLTDSYCTNGIIFNKEIIAECKIKHIGAKIDKQFGLIGPGDYDDSRQLEVKSFIGKATEFVIGKDSLNFAGIKEQLIGSSKRKLMGVEDDSIRAVLAGVGIAKTDFEPIIAELDSADDSQFGVQAAITQYAQTVPSYEKRIDLEKRGGDVISMNDKQWNHLQVVQSA